MRGEKTLLSIQVGRALAALAVVLEHVGLLTNDLVGHLPQWISSLFSQGRLGVDYFFVTSGFIILTVHMNDQRSDLPRYLWKRITRVYIPYLPVVAGIIAVYILLPTVGQGSRDWGWATSLLLIPTASRPALTVAWTLVHEINFYAFFLLFFVGRRVFFAAVLIWSAAIVASYIHPIELSASMDVILQPINLEFVLGMACAVGYRILPERYGVALLAAGVVALIIYFGVWGTEGLRGGIFAIGAALVLLGAALAESTFRQFIPNWLVTLGNASYAIYLIHDPIISVTSRIMARLLTAEMWAIAVALTFLVAVMGGLAYHFLFERPALGVVRAVWRKPLAVVG